jgi:hypothetical protein
VCKSHYIDCLIQELGISLHLESPHILRRHLRKRNSWTVMRLFYVPLEFQPKMKFPFKQRYIACSAKCCNKPLSKLLTCILSAVKTGLHSYCDTSYSRGGVNRKWILKKGHMLLFFSFFFIKFFVNFHFFLQTTHSSHHMHRTRQTYYKCK